MKFEWIKLIIQQYRRTAEDGQTIIVRAKIRHVLSAHHLQVQPQLPRKQHLLRGRLIPHHLPDSFLFYLQHRCRSEL